MDFDYRAAAEHLIVEKANWLVGQRIGQFAQLPARQTKGDVGLAVERYFGIPQNALSEADFPGAGIELKVVPVVHTPKGLRVKERTFITMMNYGSLVDETWATAHIRKKLNILFVFYEWLLDKPADGRILRVLRWQPRGSVATIVQRDWERTSQMVRDGRAHELSETQGEILGACTKGPGGGKLRVQPASAIRAPSRGFALKPSFTLNLLLAAAEGDTTIASLRSLDPLVNGFNRYVGRTVGAVAEDVGLPSSSSKNFAASVVRRAVKEAAGMPVERLGLTVRTPRVGPDLCPYEATSFPAFRHLELVEEPWEDSLLLAEIEYMFFAPVMGSTRRALPSRCKLLDPVYWRPTPDELATIQGEWTTYRDLIRSGRGQKLPGEASTDAIHVRPHGRDSRDTDSLPDGTHVTRRSFWLNRRFVQGILIAGSA